MPTRIHRAMVVLILALQQPAAWADDEQSVSRATTTMPQEDRRAPALPVSSATVTIPPGERKPPEKIQPPTEQLTSEPLPTKQPLPPGKGPAEPGFVDVVHGGISRGILASAEWLDSFFADERALQEENRTYVRVRYNAFFEDKTDAAYGPAIDLRLVLPHMQRKTRIVFTTETYTPPPDVAPEEQDTAGARVSTTTPQTRAPGEREVVGGIQYLFRETAQESFVIRTGASFSRWPPAVFAGPRYRVFFPTKPLAVRFTQEAVYRTDTQWQMESSLDLERTLPYNLFFRTNVNGIWFSRENGYFYSLNFSLSRPFGTIHAASFEWSNYYQTHTIGGLTEIALRLRYRRSVWRNWLFFELVPQCRFPRDRNFHSTAGILFRLEAFFGRTP